MTAALLPAGLLLAGLLVVGCQASASPSATPVAGSSFGPQPSFVGAPDLQATLPTEAAGIRLQGFSMSGPDFLARDPDQQFITFLDRLGADIEDVAVALAFGANSDGTQTASVFAFQVMGAQAEDLIDEFKAGAEEGGDPLIWHTERIGGKAVEVSEPNDDFPTPVVLYATGDVLYFVSSTDRAALEAIVAFLP